MSDSPKFVVPSGGAQRNRSPAKRPMGSRMQDARHRTPNKLTASSILLSSSRTSNLAVSTPDLRRRSSSTHRLDISMTPAPQPTRKLEKAPSFLTPQVNRRRDENKNNARRLTVGAPYDTKNRSTTGTKIQISLRIRPMNDDEESILTSGGLEIVDNCARVLTASQNEYLEYKFDHILNDSSSTKTEDKSQATVYETVGMPLVGQFIDNGFNCCLLAYGQTGAGKTYTLTGSLAVSGVVQKFVADVLTRLTNEIALEQSTVTISYYEIYNEHVYDLLAASKDKDNTANVQLRVREHPEHGPFVENVSKHNIENVSQFYSLLQVGLNNRATASTCFNRQSSRSHAILQITVCRNETATLSSGKKTSYARTANAYIVDLAGSEKLAKNMHDANAILSKESININQSLTTLRRVIQQTAEFGSSTAVPGFRDSVLTWLLKDCLTNNASVALLCCASPCDRQRDITLSTLRFAADASKISTKPRTNVDYMGSLLMRLNELERELEEAKSHNKENNSFDNDAVNKLQLENASLSLEIQSLSEKRTQEMEVLKSKVSSAESTLRSQSELLRSTGLLLTSGNGSEPLRVPSMVELNEDPALNVLHPLDHCIRRLVVGACSKCDLKINGLSACSTPLSLTVDTVTSTFTIGNDNTDLSDVFVNGKQATKGSRLRQGDRLCLAPGKFLIVLLQPLTKLELAKMLTKHNHGAAKAELLDMQIDSVTARAEQLAQTAFEDQLEYERALLAQTAGNDSLTATVAELRQCLSKYANEQKNERKFKRPSMAELSRIGEESGSCIDLMAMDHANRKLLPPNAGFRFEVATGDDENSISINHQSVQLHDTKNGRLAVLNSDEFNEMYDHLKRMPNNVHDDPSHREHRLNEYLRNAVTNWKPIDINSINSRAVRRSLSEQSGSVRRLRESMSQIVNQQQSTSGSRRIRATLLMQESLSDEAKPTRETQLFLGCAKRLSEMSFAISMPMLDREMKMLLSVMGACIQLERTGDRYDIVSDHMAIQNVVHTAETAIISLQFSNSSSLLCALATTNKCSAIATDQLPQISCKLNNVLCLMRAQFTDYCQLRAHGGMDESAAGAVKMQAMQTVVLQAAAVLGQALAMTDSTSLLMSSAAADTTHKYHVKALTVVYEGFISAIRSLASSCKQDCADLRHSNVKTQILTVVRLVDQINTRAGELFKQLRLNDDQPKSSTLSANIQAAFKFYYGLVGLSFCQRVLHSVARVIDSGKQQSSVSTHDSDLCRQLRSSLSECLEHVEHSHSSANQSSWPVGARELYNQMQPSLRQMCLQNQAVNTSFTSV